MTAIREQSIGPRSGERGRSPLGLHRPPASASMLSSMSDRFDQRDGRAIASCRSVRRCGPRTRSWAMASASRSSMPRKTPRLVNRRARSSPSKARAWPNCNASEVSESASPLPQGETALRARKESARTVSRSGSERSTRTAAVIRSALRSCGPLGESDLPASALARAASRSWPAAGRGRRLRVRHVPAAATKSPASRSASAAASQDAAACADGASATVDAWSPWSADDARLPPEA